ncbi:MAG: lycopene cyclase domain-containing protein [Candidatus Omnitrophica bacterium]|nr:lycopene cyclase domain-containing protein [Candidatus Omnitrophota bacterium]
MKEYTLIAAASVFLTLFLYKKSKLSLFKRKEYYLFLLVILFFKLLVNGYLTGEGIVRYNPRFFLGVRIGSIPFEDFLFGFSMVTQTIIFWEYFKKEKP